MGIEVRRAVRRRGGLPHHGDARRRGDQQGRRGGGDPRRRAEHARQLSRSRATATTSRRRRYLHALTSDTVGAYALSEPGSGSDAFGLATRAETRGRPLGPQRPEDVDHQRRRGRDLRRVRERRSGRGLQGHHGIHRRARLHGLLGRQEGRQARHPRVEHHRAHPRRLRGARRKTCSAPSARATRSPSRR